MADPEPGGTDRPVRSLGDTGPVTGVTGPWTAASPAERLQRTEALDDAARLLDRVASSLPAGPVRDGLRGRWLGHPAHPMMTDLPIGFWTASLVLDLVGGRRARPAAGLLVALGVISAAPTAATGLADWADLSPGQRRVGVVHAAVNLTATALYAKSFWARRRHRHGRGVLLGLAGAATATAGGYLGGHLAFGGDVTLTPEPVDPPREHD